MEGNAVAAAAITGLAVWELCRCYTTTAPPLGELRDSSYRTEHRQKLLDSDMMVGGLAIIAGIAASWLAKSWVPFALTIAAFLWTSCYHHLVLKGATPDAL